MKYWFKSSLYESDSECYTYNDKLKVYKVKKKTRPLAEKIAKELSIKTGFSLLRPYWITINLFGWIFCDFIPEGKSRAIIGGGYKRLFELIKNEYKFAILSSDIDENIIIFEDIPAIVINIKFFREFIKTFSNPSKRVELFLYRLPDSESEIIKRWIRGTPEALKKDNNKITPRDIIEIISKHPEVFKSDKNIELVLNKSKEFFILNNLSKMEQALNKLKEYIDNSSSEDELNKHLLENPWLISFEYANLQTERHDYFDLHIFSKKWDISKDVVVELKTANKKTENKYSTHEVISAEVGKAISQCINYLESNKEIFDKGKVIIGKDETKSLIKLNKYLHNIEVLTYGQIYEKAKRVLDFIKAGIQDSSEAELTREVANETTK